MHLKQILEKNISFYILKIYKNFIEERVTECNSQSLDPADYIIYKINLLITIQNEKIANFATFEKEYENTTEDNKKDILLAISRKLGSNSQELHQDQLALDRWLDIEVMQERLAFQNAIIRQQVRFLLAQYQYATSANFINLDFLSKIIKNQDFTLAGIKTLAALLEGLNINPTISEQGKNIALDNISASDIWIKAESLKILAILSSDQFIEYFKNIFRDNNLPLKDSIFFKSKIIKYLKYINNNEFLIEIAINDSSAYVRQSVCRYLENNSSNLNTEFALSILTPLILTDLDDAVSIYALKTIYKIITLSDDIKYFISLSNSIMSLENINNNVFIAWLVIFKKIIYGFTNINNEVYTKLNNILSKISYGNFLPLIQTIAKDLALEIAVARDKKLLNCKIKLENIIKNLKLTDKITIIDLEINSLLLEDIGKILYLIAGDDFDIEFWEQHGNYIMQRSHKKTFKLWRFLHEIFTPGSEKRQDFSHTIARNYNGEHIVLSAMSELAVSGIPGEPIYIFNEGSRRFLPPIDYLLTILSNNSEKYIFSSSGITLISSPVNFLNKIYAYLNLTFKFKYYSDLRNASGNNFFVHKLRELGIEIEFKKWQNIQGNDYSTKFFTNLSILPIFNIFDYLESPNENNLLSLIIFLIVIITILLVKRVYDYQKYSRYRSRIPLVIGGWGTRGKTGTERLKASLLAGLGFKIVSKTTGCKANIIITDSNNKLIELPIIRPYGFNTILEQKKCAIFASKYKAEIFLWECMGLKPYYANLMQDDWMQDDLSTITNTYPDHENIQGPTGEDVANSISDFIYSKSTVLTAEEIMLPLLQEAAKNKNTTLKNLTNLEQYSITQDILGLFDYYEHPSNLALNLLVAQELKLDENIALKSIIDNSLPDIGALKYFIPYKSSNREIHFINGMSANEIPAAMANWQTLGFDKMNLDTNPNIYISALVNNRFDRQKRSQEFAKIIATYLSADKYYLIGSNVFCFKKTILINWNKHLDNLIFNIQTGESLTILENEAKRLKIPINQEQKNKRINSLNFTGDSEIIQEMIKLKQEIETDYVNYTEFKDQIIANNFNVVALRKFLNEIFERKLIAIDQNSCSVNNILNIIIKSTPIGFINKIMGMQNIKSPGMEFIKAWQAYEQCINACNNIKNNVKTQNFLEILAQFSWFSILTKTCVQETIAAFKNSNNNLKYSELINQIELNLHKIQSNQSLETKYNLLNKLLEIIEDCKNVKKAHQIYLDLAHNRISVTRAQIELAQIIQLETH